MSLFHYFFTENEAEMILLLNNFFSRKVQISKKKQKYNQESIWTPGITRYDESVMKSYEILH